MHDLVIRGGTIVDGTGQPGFSGDVAIAEGRIVSVGGKAGPAHREIDADGLVVCPGFVDTHTHYDGQVTWDPYLTPSSWHGVTTAIMGNCGVGFAPVRPGGQDYLIEVMEGVEDIPGTALAEGMTWDWESFPDYLDALDRQPRAIDVAAQIPHAALRCYVMGCERALDIATTEDDLGAMARLTEEAMRAGAVGFSTGRTFLHRTRSGDEVPGTQSHPGELLAIARAMAAGGSGVFQMISDNAGREPDLPWMKEIGRITGRPVVFSLVDLRREGDFLDFRRVLDQLQHDWDAERVDIRAAVPWRPPGFIYGLLNSLNPFSYYPAYAAIADLPLAERLAIMRQPDFRTTLLDGGPDMSKSLTGLATQWDRMFPMVEDFDYEPRAEDCIASRAQAAGVSPQEFAYDYLTGDDGTRMIFVPIAGFQQGNHDILHEQLSHPRCFASLSDGGAHVASVSDASFSSYMITHWVTGRKRGVRLPLEHVIHQQTGRAAQLYGLHDRGVLASGRKADVNIIDVDGMRLFPPYMAYDLPMGGKRLLQKAHGFRHTLVAGTPIMEAGEATGALPGRLVRGAG